MARQPFNTRWAQGVEAEDSLNSFKVPSDVRLSTGWEGGQGKDAPPAGQENWWHNRVDSALQGVERKGVMAWHALAIYGLGAPTHASDGNYYESLSESNIGNNPVSTTGFWQYIGTSFFSRNDPGDLKMVAHNNAPANGWLKCNGAVLIRASYPLLFAAIGTANNSGGETSLQFRLPDYRGEFLRGFDDGRGVNIGRIFGSAEADETRSHSHTMAEMKLINANVLIPITVGAELSREGVGPMISTGAFGGPETRPRNKVVNYWIKY